MNGNALNGTFGLYFIDYLLYICPSLPRTPDYRAFIDTVTDHWSSSEQCASTDREEQEAFLNGPSIGGLIAEHTSADCDLFR